MQLDKSEHRKEQFNTAFVMQYIFEIWVLLLHNAPTDIDAHK